jgi:CheY-like chemotaxis protein
MINNDKPSQILIVDDSQLDLELLDHFMRENGYRTVTAQTGAEALEFIQSNSPDLILLDISYNGKRTWCNAIKLRQDPSLQRDGETMPYRGDKPTANVPTPRRFQLSSLRDSFRSADFVP